MSPEYVLGPIGTGWTSPFALLTQQQVTMVAKMPDREQLHDEAYAETLRQELETLTTAVNKVRAERDQGRQLLEHLQNERATLRLQHEQRRRRQELLLEVSRLQELIREKKAVQAKAAEELGVAKKEYERLLLVGGRWPSPRPRQRSLTSSKGSPSPVSQRAMASGVITWSRSATDPVVEPPPLTSPVSRASLYQTEVQRHQNDLGASFSSLDHYHEPSPKKYQPTYGRRSSRRQQRQHKISMEQLAHSFSSLPEW